MFAKIPLKLYLGGGILAAASAADEAEAGVVVGDAGQVRVLQRGVEVGRDSLAYHKVYQVDGAPHLAEHSVPVLPGRHAGNSAY